MNQYIISAIWLCGFLLSYWMIKVEHESEKEQFTHGDKVLIVILSMFSVLMILFILVSTWIKKIGKTGYWNKPVKPKAQ